MLDVLGCMLELRCTKGYVRCTLRYVMYTHLGMFGVLRGMLGVPRGMLGVFRATLGIDRVCYSYYHLGYVRTLGVPRDMLAVRCIQGYVARCTWDMLAVRVLSALCYMKPGVCHVRCTQGT